MLGQLYELWDSQCLLGISFLIFIWQINNRRRWRDWQSTPVNVFVVVVETKFFLIKFSVVDKLYIFI